MARNFVYDAEDRQVSATINGLTTNYTYDGYGNRVMKTSGSQSTVYVYDAFGSLAAEYSTQSAASPCGTPTCYLTADHLGSTRLLTDSSGNAVRRYDYESFGTEIPSGVGGRSTAMGYTATPDSFNLKFTGQERDSETGLDYFHARYYSAAQGRFQGPDPENAGASLTDPQSWNGYAYVNNNPMMFTDPDGEGIFGFLFGLLGRFLGGPWGHNLGSVLGNGIDAAIWGPDADKGTFLGNSLGSLGGLSGGGGLSGPGGSVYGGGSTGGVIFSFEDQYKNGRLELPGGDVAIYGWLGKGGPVLRAAGTRAYHDAVCVVPGFAIGGVGGVGLVGGQPNAGFRSPITNTLVGGSKPHAGQGMSQGSSTISEWLRGTKIGQWKLPGGRIWPAPKGYPWPGGRFGRTLNDKLGPLAGRWAPYIGFAGMAYGAYQVNGCLSQ
jgi:RHS repeat-associated protein